MPCTHSWADAAGIGTPASVISVRYRSSAGIVILYNSGSRLSGCRTVCHSGIYSLNVYTADAEDVAPCTSTLLVVERDTPSTNAGMPEERQSGIGI